MSRKPHDTHACEAQTPHVCPVQRGLPLAAIAASAPAPVAHLSSSSQAAAAVASSAAAAAAAGSWALLPTLLQEHLVRLACRCPALSAAVVALLTRALACCPLASDTER